MRIVILGPTGSGKSNLAYEISKKINGEIVSADSRQVYRYLNIGTNKELFSDVKTHLIDLINPNETYNVYNFKKDSLKAIKEIESQGKVAIITGGTNFYIQSLIYNINYKKSKKIIPLEDKSKEELWEILKNKDLTFYNNLNNSDKNNIRRLIRYINIEKLDNKKKPLKIDPKYIVFNIDINKNDIIKNIEYRTHQMIQKGLIEEVISILDMGFKENDPGMKILGYLQVIDFKNGKIKSEEELEQKINQATYKLIKKQITFQNNILDKKTMSKDSILGHIEKSHF
jgi:tRNA dimethylallyltransferase